MTKRDVELPMNGFGEGDWDGMVHRLDKLTTRWLLGTKFVVLHSLPHSGVDDLLRKVYEICASTCTFYIQRTR